MLWIAIKIASAKRSKRYTKHLILRRHIKNHHFISICFQTQIASILAQLSQRLIGELIGYSWSGVRPSSVVVRRKQCSNIFSKTASPIKAKCYVEPPWVGGTKVCSRHLGHMAKIAATPIYGKTLQKSSSPEPAGRFSRNLVCSIGDSSLSYFVQMMILE